MNRNIICIAGAHRSGTSMLTRLVAQCGLTLGAEADLMPAAADNPDGFWENVRFVQINDEVLNATGSAWDLPPAADETFEEDRVRPIRAKAELLIDRFQAEKTWGWKDPRNSLTLPFWKKLLPELKTVIMVRNPLEVAYSMHARNGTSYALAIRLWEIYNRRLLANTNPGARVVTHYTAFFENAEAALSRIVSFVGVAQDRTRTAAAIVNVGRRHTSFTFEQLLDAGVPESVVSLYRALTEEAAGAKPATASSDGETAEAEGLRLAGASAALDLRLYETEKTRRELARRRGDAIQQEEEIARLHARIERLTAEIGKRDGSIQELRSAYAQIDQKFDRERAVNAELHKRTAEFGKLTADHRHLLDEHKKLCELNAKQLQTHDAEKAKLRQHMLEEHELNARQSREIEKLRDRFVQSNRQLQATSIRLSESESRAESLTERLRAQLQQTRRLMRLLDDIASAALRLRESRRWFLANFFSAVRAKLSGRALPGFGHLDKNVKRYQAWQSDHPDMAEIDEAIQALRPRQIPAPLAAPSLPPDGSNGAISQIVRRPAEPLAFPRHKDVEVSIVIPVYNQLDFTQACLTSIQQYHDDIQFEVIVVDDCSTDATAEAISQIPGIVYLRNATNSGFVASCNAGTERARGNYLLFLNNDTTVTPGWLSTLLETFVLHPAAGLVGSKLVYPDGRLQEAGCIIWRDGSGWNRGKFQDPRLPEYNYLCEVDYCSAASVMIRRQLFNELGGFDEKYAPAYYEDTDLAFKVAQAGRKVLYQPLSVVIHHEGITAGTDLAAGAKKYQQVNQATFTTKWADRLAGRPIGGDVETWNMPAPGKKRILVIDHHLPLMDRDSGSLRMFQILTILQQLGHKLTFIPDNLADIPPYGDALRKRGIEILHHPHIKSVADHLQRNGSSYDVVLLSRCDFAIKHIATVKAHAPHSRIIFDTVDLHFLRLEREAQMTDDPRLKKKAAETRRLELELISQADETWVVSPIEQELLEAAAPKSTCRVVSNIVEVELSPVPFALRHDILFIGSFQHSPNVDAVLYFAREILPTVLRELPQLRFYIIGDKAPPAVMALTSENIIITGFQPNVRPYFDGVRLSIAPLRWGAGVKGKINQSMGLGVPVVATTVAVEGMALTNRENILIADEPQAFARAVIDLYQSEDLWNRVSANGIETTRRRYSSETATKQLSRLFGDDQVRLPELQDTDSNSFGSARRAPDHVPIGVGL